MVKDLKFAVVSAILLFPFAFPQSAHSRTFLGYQEAVWMCGAGDPQACDAVYFYEAAPSKVRRGPISTQDFIVR
jgi:hypothetical protein